MICPKCGHDAGNSKFCPECGEKMGYGEPEEFDFLSGNQSAQSKSYVSAASQPVINHAPVNKPQYNQNAAPVNQPQYGQNGAPVGQYYQGNGQRPMATAPKKSHTGLIIGIIAAVIVVILIIIIAVAAGGSKDKSSSSDGGDIGDYTYTYSVSDAEIFDNRETATAAGQVTDDDFTYTPQLMESGNYTYDVIAVKNNSLYSVGISINATAKDASGNIVGADDASIDVIGPGEETVVFLSFDEVTGVASVDYSYSYDMDPYYESCASYLSVSQTINDQNVVLSVTNNGEKAARYVRVFAVFYDASGNIVDWSSGYVGDSTDNILPGATLTKQLTTYKDFSTVKVYYDGDLVD